MTTEDEFEKQKAAILEALGDDVYVYRNFPEYFTLTPKDREAATKVSNYLADHHIKAEVDITKAPAQPTFVICRPSSNPSSSCIIL